MWACERAGAQWLPKQQCTPMSRLRPGMTVGPKGRRAGYARARLFLATAWPLSFFFLAPFLRLLAPAFTMGKLTVGKA
jgi:hypothetical protein